MIAKVEDIVEQEKSQRTLGTKCAIALASAAVLLGGYTVASRYNDYFVQPAVKEWKARTAKEESLVQFYDQERVNVLEIIMKADRTHEEVRRLPTTMAEEHYLSQRKISKAVEEYETPAEGRTWAEHVLEDMPMLLQNRSYDQTDRWHEIIRLKARNDYLFLEELKKNYRKYVPKHRQ